MGNQHDCQKLGGKRRRSAETIWQFKWQIARKCRAAPKTAENFSPRERQFSQGAKKSSRELPPPPRREKEAGKSYYI